MDGRQVEVFVRRRCAGGSGPATRERRTGAWPALLVVLATALAPARGIAGEVRFETDNDFLTSNPEDDDLYTFSLAFAWEWGGQMVRLRENAFTDKEAGLRFDETYLTLARELPLRGGWRGSAELGFVHVGRGLFGQSIQNGLHRAIGSREVDLDYAEPARFHPWALLNFDRHTMRGRRLAFGPRFTVSAAPGFHSFAMAGFRLEWDAPGVLAFAPTLGARLSDTVFEPLEPHVSGVALYGSLEVAVWDRLIARWSYNAYGTERQHVALAWRFRPGDGRPVRATFD